MYHTQGNEKKIHNIYLSEKNAAGQEEEAGSAAEGQAAGGQVTVKQALFTDERYKRSSWVAILVMAFQCLTGYYAIIAYSSVLLEDDFGESSGRNINARQGVFLINGFNLLGSFTSIYLIEKIGRRPIFLIG